MSLDKTYRASRYATHDELNRDDWWSNLNGEFKTQNLLWELKAGFMNDHPSSSEPGINAGALNFNRITRNRWNIGPTLTWELSDLTSVQASYEFSETGFQDDDENQPRTDFIVHSASLGLFRLINPTTQVFGQFSYVGFFTTPSKSFVDNRSFHDFNNNLMFDAGETLEEPLGDGNGDGIILPGEFIDIDGDNIRDSSGSTLSRNIRQSAKTEQLILQVGFTHALSETLNVSMSGGNVWLLSKQRTSNLFFTDGGLVIDNAQSTRNKQTAYILNFKLNKDFEYSKLTAELDRSVSPTFDGGQVERNQATIVYQHKLRKTLRAFLRFDAFETRTIEGVPGGVSQTDRNRYVGEIKMIWDFAEHWRLTGTYNYQYEDQKQDTFGPRDMNTVYLGINYKWSPLSVFP